jgi:glycine dehydrogenase
VSQSVPPGHPVPHAFVDRHIGPSESEVASMLEVVGAADLDALTAQAVPAAIYDDAPLRLPAAASEQEVLAELRELAARNTVLVPMIGCGYSGTVTPPVVRRRVLEDPGWYTAYTPYQPEISQGRLEALLNYQTVVADLTGLPTSNASLLDEATAAAEAMAVLRRAHKGAARVFVVDADVFPQTLAVLRTRAEAVGIDVVVADLLAGDPANALPDGEDVFGLLVQYPAASGRVVDHRGLTAAAAERGIGVVVSADPLALTLLEAPGEWGADVVVGSAQRFGVPMAFGGPHAAFMAVRKGLERQIPGRLVGVSVDADGNPAMRLALQTREQHIRRDKATSNICTAQVLLAVVAAMYAVHHGPDGLKGIAWRTHRHAARLAAGLEQGGLDLVHHEFFDTVRVSVPGRAHTVLAAAADLGINLHHVDADTVGISTSEITVDDHIDRVWQAFGITVTAPASDAGGDQQAERLPQSLLRTDDILRHPVFHEHRSETAMLRYLRSLRDKDYALDRGMIPLGSCTMKLNAAVEMEPITWHRFADLHPFAPLHQARGTLALVRQLEQWLCEVTGYDAVSVQPNAGSQGEFAGLMAIRAFHRSRGDLDRDVCLIPSSAHGTNAASAVMAGMRVVVVACDDTGNVDLDDLQARIDEHRDRLAALMITYPSTHGVYEDTVTQVCAMVHDAGGQVYVDGANLNALVGLARPGSFGADVSHLNLHKTFCIPHGGGGPGVGPVAVRSHLAPFLPNHPLVPEAGPATGVGPVSAAPWGSAGVLPIPWAYIRLMGPDGVRRATQVAVLAANYIAVRLAPHFPILYSGDGGRVAHECILDVRALTAATGVTVDDIAKRLVDYGFHAPTMSFPVAGTLMVEPTESEDLAELDRFCEAMIAIRGEIARVEAGGWAVEDSPLRHAPHTAAMLTHEWDRVYSRTEAVFPHGVSRDDKYWPPVRRIDGAYGDRNLVCSCPSPAAFAEAEEPVSS